jgi:hypothetical protein
MNPTGFGSIFAASLFLGMLALLELGYRIGKRRLAKDPEEARQGLGAVDGAVFGLLGLLVAFTFSGAASRFDARRQLIVTEANTIGTAWQRVDLLPADEQPVMRDMFRRYLDSRLKTYRLLPDVAGADAEFAESVRLQAGIWRKAVALCQANGDPAVTALVLPTLNAMSDITTVRTEMARIHPPAIIFGLLFGLALACSLLAGYGMAGGKERSWSHTIGFAGVLALSVYVIFEIEYPRLGLITLDKSDQVLVELRAAMD